MLISAIICGVISFFLGSIPWGVIISRMFYHTDIRRSGSGNIGTTNALRTLGKRGGVAVFLLDFAKGFASAFVPCAVLALMHLAPMEPFMNTTSELALQALAFACCTLGHIFSPWLSFKGGKGIAVAFGCLLPILGPLPWILEFMLFLILAVVSRYVSLGSCAAALSCPFMTAAVFPGKLWVIGFFSIGSLAVVWAHRGNIARLLNGTEKPFSVRSKQRQN